MPNRTAAAFAVHGLTASGALWALLALIAAAAHDWPLMFLWLGLAMVVDGIDGPLARRVDIGRTLPRWSGEVLDLVIDFVTYVVVPAFALTQAAFLPGWLGLALGGAIVVIGALYFADLRMKTEDHSFEGFPGCWNFFVFMVFVLQPPAALVALSVVVLAVLSFLPVRFVHPVRTRRLRPLTLAVTALWGGFAIYAVTERLAPPGWATAALTAASGYLFLIGAVLQVTERRRAAG